MSDSLFWFFRTILRAFFAFPPTLLTALHLPSPLNWRTGSCPSLLALLPSPWSVKTMSFTVYFLNRFRTFPSFPSPLPFSTFRPSLVTILFPLSLCKDLPASRPPLSLHLGHCCWASRCKNQIAIMPALCWRFPFPLLSLTRFVHPFKHSSRASRPLPVCSECLPPGGHCTLCLASWARSRGQTLLRHACLSSS